MHDVIIVGAGPAGLGAALYAIQNELKTLLITKEFLNVDSKPDIFKKQTDIKKTTNVENRENSEKQNEPEPKKILENQNINFAQSFFTLKKIQEQLNLEVQNKNPFLEFKNNQEVILVEKNIVSFSAETKSGLIFYSRSLILACGEKEQNLENITTKDLNNHIKVDFLQNSDVLGLFAAGKIVSGKNIDEFLAAAQGARAALSAKEFLEKKLEL